MGRRRRTRSSGASRTPPRPTPNSRPPAVSETAPRCTSAPPLSRCRFRRKTSPRPSSGATRRAAARARPSPTPRARTCGIFRGGGVARGGRAERRRRRPNTEKREAATAEKKVERRRRRGVRDPALRGPVPEAQAPPRPPGPERVARRRALRCRPRLARQHEPARRALRGDARGRRDVDVDPDQRRVDGAPSHHGSPRQRERLHGAADVDLADSKALVRRRRLVRAVLSNI
mmetsp:Transcript_5464/g.16835  ORF Transcript_5464/g.16835 Transcript_5464/m.16835 type:complete len:231 (+) Transcript_5464:1510-2202(+)